MTPLKCIRSIMPQAIFLVLLVLTTCNGLPATNPFGGKFGGVYQTTSDGFPLPSVEVMIKYGCPSSCTTWADCERPLCSRHVCNPAPLERGGGCISEADVIAEGMEKYSKRPLGI